MARNEGIKKAKKSEPEYMLGRDADGNPTLVPYTPEAAPARSPFARIPEAAMEQYGYAPLGLSDKTKAEYPNLAPYIDPVAKGLDALRRAPGAAAGALSGAVGAGSELWSGSRAQGDYDQRQAQALLDYLGAQGAATMGGPRPSARIPRNGEVFPPERGPAPQLGYTERPPVDVYRELPPGAIRGTSAEGLPRIGREDPLSRYGQSVDYTYGVGPRRPYDRMPVVDQTYTLPQELNTRPEVTTEPHPISTLTAESPEQAQRAGTLARQGRAATAYEQFLEDIRATNEGMPERGARPPSAPAETPPSQPFNAPASEPTVSPFQTRPAPGVTRRPAPTPPPAPAPMQFGLNGPQPVTGAFENPMTGRAYQPRTFQPTRGGATGQMVNPMTGEVIIPSETVDLAKMIQEQPRAPASMEAEAATAAAEPTSGPWGAIPQPSKGLPPGSTYTPAAAAAPVNGLPTPKGWTFNDTLGMGSLGVLGAVADREERRQKKTAQTAMDRQRIDDMDEAALAAVRSGAGAPTQASFPSNAMDRAYVPNVDSFQNWLASQRSASLPAQTQGQPSQASGSQSSQQRPAQTSAAPAARSDGTLFDRIFSGKDYQSMGGQLQQQNDRGQRVVNWGSPDNSADFFRAAALQRKLDEDKQQYTGASGSDIESSQGRKQGGAVEQKPSKEAMLHKSLEIIHHMIRNR